MFDVYNLFNLGLSPPLLLALALLIEEESTQQIILMFYHMGAGFSMLPVLASILNLSNWKLT